DLLAEQRREPALRPAGPLAQRGDRDRAARPRDFARRPRDRRIRQPPARHALRDPIRGDAEPARGDRRVVVVVPTRVPPLRRRASLDQLRRRLATTSARSTVTPVSSCTGAPSTA